MAESKPNNIGIYKITSPSKKIYIGQSRDIRKRKEIYKYPDKKLKGQPRIYNSIKKYGFKEHKFDILCYCQESELNKLEAYYIELYQSFNTPHGMNLTSGGDCFKVSDETRAKQSARAKNRTKEHTAKIALANKGRKISLETRAKLSLAMTGKKASKEALEKMRGRTHNEETKAKMSAAQKGKKKSVEHLKNIALALQNRTEEAKAKQVAVWIGRKHRPESIAKMSAAAKGKIVSKETRQKISLANTGRKWSTETIAKMRGRKWTPEQKLKRQMNPIKLSEESRKKLSSALTGRKLSKETRLKIGLIHKGKKLSAETKAKISAKNKGRIWSVERNKKVSLAKRGVRLSIEHISNQRKARKDNGNYGRKIINLETGIIFPSLQDAASFINMKNYTLRDYLHNRRPNKTPLRYYDPNVHESKQVTQ